MLHPKFFQIPPSLRATNPDYVVTGYTQSRQGEYVLITWEISDGDEKITGETLFSQEGEEIVSAGGQIDLGYSTPTGNTTISLPTTTHNAVSPTRYVPPAVARQLREIATPGVIHVRFRP